MEPLKGNSMGKKTLMDNLPQPKPPEAPRRSLIPTTPGIAKSFDSEWRAIRHLNQRDLEIGMNKFLHVSIKELKKEFNDGNNDYSSMDNMLMGIIIKAVDAGDAVRLEFILSRLLGKVKQEVSLSANITKTNYNVDVNSPIDISKLSLEQLEALEGISKALYGNKADNTESIETTAVIPGT